MLLFKLKNNSKTCVIPTVCSPKATLNIFNVYIDLSQFTVKLDVATPFFQACHFL
jgi:hypothetical protein